MDRTSVVFIAGFGRSGSSLLEMLLSRDIAALSAGELCNLFEWTRLGQNCTCGVPVSKCPIWGPVVHAVSASTGLSFLRLDEITRAAERRGIGETQWHVVWSATFQALRAHHGVTTVIDSSKTAGGQRRLALMSRSPSLRVAVAIHLARNLAGVMHSMKRGTNKGFESRAETSIRYPAMKAAYGWLVANAAARRQANMAENRLAVRYDNLEVEYPRLVHMCRKYIGTNAAPSIIGHAIAGNRTFRSGVELSIRPDNNWVRGLARWERWVARSLDHAATLIGIAPPSRPPGAARGARPHTERHE